MKTVVFLLMFLATLPFLCLAFVARVCWQACEAGWVAGGDAVDWAAGLDGWK